MKTKNYALTAMAIFIAAAVSAVKLPTFKIVETTNNKVLVAFEVSEPAVVELSVKNSWGEILYCNKSETPVEKLHVILDFHTQQYGVYDVGINYNNYKINRKITIANYRLKNVGKEERAFVPYYTFEDNLLKISYFNNNLENVYMKIYHEGNCISKKKIGKEMCIQKVYNLSKLESGKYKIVLSNWNDDYQFIVNK